MNRIDQCFATLRRTGKKAVIPFLTAGFPSMKETEKTALLLLNNGADMLELGVPFSDPIAETPEIQRASLHALETGTTLDTIFELVRNLRKVTEKPLVLTMYLNTIFVYGSEKFFTLCGMYGVDGVIVPDMPYEEREELLPYAKKTGIYCMNMVSPVSKERIREIAANSEGFLTCVSPNRFPEQDSDASKELGKFFRLVEDNHACPYCIGTDLSDPDDIVTAASLCNGIVLNRALVAMLSDEASDGNAAAVELIKKLRERL